MSIVTTSGPKNRGLNSEVVSLRRSKLIVQASGLYREVVSGMQVVFKSFSGFTLHCFLIQGET